jgi:hypothetical protein
MIEYLPLVLTGIGLIVSILYYAIILRNANRTQRMQLETRQVQLFMNIDATRGSPEFQKLIYRVIFMDEWKDIDDYLVKYGPENNLDAYSEHSFIWQRFESLGLLLKKNIIDLSYFDDLIKVSALAAWNKFEPVINAMRVRVNQPNLYNHFEYLANEIRNTQ